MKMQPSRVLRSRADAAEQELLECFDPNERSQTIRAPERTGVDFLLAGRDGAPRYLIELKAQLHAARELHAAIAALAMYTARAPEIERGWLLVRHTKLTPQRLEQEWREVLRVLRPDVAKKLAAIALTSSGPWRSDNRAAIEPIECWAKRSMVTRQADERDGPIRVHPAVPRAKFFEVWKVLLSAWLRSEGPLAIHEIGERAGAAHPTVAEALKRLEHRGEIRRRSDRSAELRFWPAKTYAELELLLPALRRTLWFVDRSGRPAEPVQLLRRLRKLAPPHVGLGGVEAARRLDPAFDLLGTPRVDLTVHAPHGTTDLEFVRKLDPALAQADMETGAVLAVHQLTRPQSLFDERDQELLADPAEVVLDLAELRLHSQLGDLVQRLGGEL